MEWVVPSPVATASADTPSSATRAGRLPPDAGGDPLQHTDGAQRGRRRVRGRGGQPLGDLDQEGGQRLGEPCRLVADEGQVGVPVRERPGQIDARLGVLGSSGRRCSVCDEIV
ncbi:MULTISPECIES: hypothetical protein [Streptomyces]|uniref:Uncharacterized protein n=1 Tax=Streptomyces virginiae TaxID=1961 RepID=A0ABZ1TN04_STRVG|nr:hypothetical protein [Streptomyces virginiae]WTB27229.1 hypothetical protein OG253_40445 [Streptomyces virginiae]